MSRRLARHGGRRAHRLGAVALAAAICLAMSSGPALAADPAGTPSAEQLRETYPLETTPPKRRPVATPTARPPSKRTPERAAEKNGGSLMSNPFVVVVLMLIVLLLSGFVLEVWHTVRRAPPEPTDDAAVPKARNGRKGSLAILGAGVADHVSPPPSPPVVRTPPPEHEPVNRREPRRPRPRRRFTPRREVPAASPPDAAREWTAEIAWRNGEGGPRFAVCARRGDGCEKVILTSDVVEWPPRDDDAVAGLERVVRDLRTQLLDAGWTPAEAGEAWYAERFAWAPQDSSPDPDVTSSSRVDRGRNARRVGRPGINSG